MLLLLLQKSINSIYKLKTASLDHPMLKWTFTSSVTQKLVPYFSDVLMNSLGLAIVTHSGVCSLFTTIDGAQMEKKNRN